MKTRWLLLLCVALAAAPAWGADDPAMLDRHVTAINRTARTPEGRQVVAQRLSEDLGISAKTLQAQRQRTGLGWGEILIANRISQRTGMSFDQVVAEFRHGKGWGAIAREHNLSLGKLVSEVKTSHTTMQSSFSASGRGRSRGGDGGITFGGNHAEADASAGAAAGAGAQGHGVGRGADPGVTFGTGASGHASGGLGRGGGRR